MDTRIRPLLEVELDQADNVFRLAFGTFLGLPDPVRMFPDTDLVRTRFRTDPSSFFAAESTGDIVGSNFATNWGSVGFFGPLTVRPDLWDQGIGSKLMEPIMEKFQTWGCSHTGLFTFPHSAKHHGLYQKFGFWPRFLTPVLEKPTQAGKPAPARWSSYIAAAEADRPALLKEIRAITESIYPGLDVTRSEIEPLARNGWGDVVLVDDGARLVAFAVCHCGRGTEAESDVCYVKFGGLRPGEGAERHFEQLLDSCLDLAKQRGLAHLSAGVNMGRHRAYRAMLGRGFRAGMLTGVTMHRPNEDGYDRADSFIIDDWR